MRYAFLCLVACSLLGCTPPASEGSPTPFSFEGEIPLTGTLIYRD